MAAILRVKRRNDDEPLDALVVACKKLKTEPENAEGGTTSAPLTAVIKFAGTVKDRDEDVIEHITNKLSKEDLKTHYKQHIVDITGKARKETKQASTENRFKVLNHFRSLDNWKEDDPEIDDITVIDIEDTASCATKKDSDQKEDYVYDLYYTSKDEDFTFETDMAIKSFNEALVFDPYREKGAMDSDNEYESEDSNSESNVRNDYPDSEHSEDSILEEDMREAVEKIKIHGEDSDLSSEDEDFAYGLDEHDVDYFGADYAKYKAKLKKEWGNDDSNSSSHGSSESGGIGDLDD